MAAYVQGARDTPGDNNGAVHVLQRALAAAGYNPGPIDGIYGAQTAAAMHAFQQAKGLPVGSADDATQHALGIGTPTGAAGAGPGWEGEFRTKYPELAWTLDVPDLRSLAEQAVANKWDATTYQSKLFETTWWKTTPPATRQWLYQRNADPAAAEAQIAQRTMDISNMGSTMGFPPGTDNPMYREIAETSLRLGWTDAQIRTQLATNLGQYGPDHAGHPGEAWATGDSVRNLAASYGLQVGEADAWEWSKRILGGSMTLEGLEAMYRDQMKAMYPQFADQVDQGANFAQIVAPYKQQLSTLLEIAPDQIDFLNSNRFKQVIDYVDDQGNHRPMTNYEVGRWARELPEWANTDQSRGQSASVAQTLLETFGKVAA